MSLLDFNPTFIEKYEAGLPNINGPKDMKIVFKDVEGIIEFKTVGLFFGEKVILTPEQIVEIGLGQNSYRHAGKTATGAIIGGVLTGGVGLIAGAALGGKRRNETKLELVVNLNGFEHKVYFKSRKNTQKLYSAFINFLSKKRTETPSALPQQNIQPNNPISTTSTSLGELSSGISSHGISEKWYDKIWLVILLCLFFFPVGLYGLWQSNVISRTWKIIGTVIVAAIVIVALNDKSVKA